MAIKFKQQSAGANLSRTETVTIRLDPRLNYLCEIGARSQRRTKSSFIEAAVDEKIRNTKLQGWRSQGDSSATIAEMAELLWHVRDYERLISLGLNAPHLMTQNEQEVWAAICDCGGFWFGEWVDRGDVAIWQYKCDEPSIRRDVIADHWKNLLKVATNEEDKSTLPPPPSRPKKGNGIGGD